VAFPKIASTLPVLSPIFSVRAPTLSSIER
jgi:hypothetical protein